jgi:hypothetical protein
MRKLDWKQDGSDLMEEAETYYQEAISTNRWGRRAQKQEVQDAFKSVESGAETDEEKEKPSAGSYEEMIKALTAQLQEQVTAYTARWSGQSPKAQQDKRYAWKKVPPKSGEPSTKKMLTDGKHKIYYWCPHHLEWTIHKPSECKRLRPRRRKKDYKDKKTIKRQNFKETRKRLTSKPKQPIRHAWVWTQMRSKIPWTLIMTGALTSRNPATHQREATLLDMKGVRNGDQFHLMQPISLY